MIGKHLKTFRKSVALIVLTGTSIVFLDLHGMLTQTFVSTVLYFQFIPSLMKFSVTAGLGAAGFIVVVVLALFAGRIYCSFLCPLGVSIDFIGRCKVKTNSGKMSFSKPYNKLRYTVLVLTVVTFAFGTLWGVNLLDPYSNFGRVMAVVVKPFFSLINNSLTLLLEMLDIYVLTPYVQTGFDLPVIMYVAVFVGIVVVLSVKRGRLYCNTLCPVGALLGLISKCSYVKLGVDVKTCTRCKTCERVCKAECIDSRSGLIDMSRCVSCYNCLDSCPEGSISFIRSGRTNPAESHEQVDSHRRSLLVVLACVVTGFSKAAFAITKPVVYVKNKIPVIRKYPITPPGSISIDHFTGRCTACHLCVTACPGKVIQPEFSGFGAKGVLMPRMINKFGYCNFNCTRCGEVCPTGAILPVDRERKIQLQIGKVKFIKKNCIVITQKTECGACSEHCPTKAVFMIVENNLRVPEVNTDICVGCGACEYACPAIPHKSIYVEGNPVHKIADKPKINTLEPFNPDDDFPF